MQINALSYCGNRIHIDESSKTKLLNETITLSGELSSTSQKAKSENWLQLKKLIENLGKRVTVPDQFHMEEYRFQILMTAVLPYMHTMQSRMSLEPRRFHQITRLLHILTYHTAESTHPAEVLLALDEELRGIKAEQGWWQSELGTSLQGAIDLQWMPILQDHRKGLRNVGQKLIILGLVEFIRPIVLVYPAWLLLSEASMITKQLQMSEKLEAKSLMAVIKAALLLCAALLQMQVIALVPGIGYSCLVLGVLCYIITQSNAMLKPLTPLLAENLCKLDEGIDVLTALQETFLGRVNSLVEFATSSSRGVGSKSDNISNRVNSCNNHSSHGSNSSGSGSQTCVVEEVDVGKSKCGEKEPQSENDLDCVMEVDTAEKEEEPAISNLHSTGMRKRK